MSSHATTGGFLWAHHIINNHVFTAPLDVLTRHFRAKSAEWAAFVFEDPDMKLAFTAFQAPLLYLLSL